MTGWDTDDEWEARAFHILKAFIFLCNQSTSYVIETCKMSNNSFGTLCQLCGGRAGWAKFHATSVLGSSTIESHPQCDWPKITWPQP